MNWLLPEHIADALPREAAHIERLRRRLLDRFRVHGYELVMPPLLEYLDSLLTGAGQDLKLKTFKIVDQLSGRTMGVRADMTPQVSRIDAHLLNRTGVCRLCYCDSVLHTLPSSMTASREPIQAGAELYGYAGLEADLEIVRLMAGSIEEAGISGYRIDFGHVGIFKGLVELAGAGPELQAELHAALQAKDVPGLRDLTAGMADAVRGALIALPGLFGGAETLLKARAVLPAHPMIGDALATLDRVAEAASELPVGFDLSDLRGYHYHSGVVFAAYTPGFAGAIALGGRYDGVGAAFGRTRPATGFSLDLRELARLAPVERQAGGILAPASGVAGLADAIAALRRRGEVVVSLLPGETGSDGPACDRRLVEQGGAWAVEPL